MTVMTVAAMAFLGLPLSGGLSLGVVTDAPAKRAQASMGEVGVGRGFSGHLHKDVAGACGLDRLPESRKKVQGDLPAGSRFTNASMRSALILNGCFVFGFLLTGFVGSSAFNFGGCGNTG